MPARTNRVGGSRVQSGGGSISKQITLGNLSTESRELIITNSKIPRLREADSGSPLSSPRRPRESTRSVESECLKVFDPFERVLLTTSGGIDNAMITSARTLKQENNLISPYSYKIIHSNFAPHALSKIKKATYNRNKMLRSFEERESPARRSTVAIATGYLS